MVVRLLASHTASHRCDDSDGRWRVAAGGIGVAHGELFTQNWKSRISYVLVPIDENAFRKSILLHKTIATPMPKIFPSGGVRAGEASSTESSIAKFPHMMNAQLLLDVQCDLAPTITGRVIWHIASSQRMLRPVNAFLCVCVFVLSPIVSGRRKNRVYENMFACNYCDCHYQSQWKCQNRTSASAFFPCHVLRAHHLSRSYRACLGFLSVFILLFFFFRWSISFLSHRTHMHTGNDIEQKKCTFCQEKIPK